MNTFETNIYINDIELSAVVEYDYQPAEKAFYDYMTGNCSAGISEEAQITSCLVETPTGISFEMFSKEYDWLLTEDLLTDLEEDALANHKASEESYMIEREDHLINLSKEAA